MYKSKASVAVVDDHILMGNGLANLIRSFDSFAVLNDREIEFLKLACTEMTYKEIAEKMYLSARTIDGYRDALFEKLNVKSRVGLVMYAIRTRIVSV
jgi:DNA-binding NarL/FixJ family response regulator